MTETIITVEGVFEHHHPAERGTVKMRVGFQGPDRAAVVARTTELHARLSGDIRSIHDGTNGPVTWWSTDRLRVWNERPWNNEGKQLPLVHHAAIGFDVKFSDLGRLAGWVEAVSPIDGVTVTSIEWALTVITKKRLTDDARDRAVRDAVEKANAYASSLGLTNVRPTALAEPGMLGDQTQPSSGVTAAPLMRAAAATSNAPSLELKPEDIVVAARVHARFAAS